MSATFGSYEFHEADYSVWLDIRSGLRDGRDYAGGDTVVPALSGTIPGNRVGRGRKIVLEGWIHAATASAFETLWQGFVAAFDPELGIQSLSYPLEDGTTATIDAIAENVVFEDEALGGRTQRLSVELTAPGGVWTIA